MSGAWLVTATGNFTLIASNDEGDSWVNVSVSNDVFVPRRIFHNGDHWLALSLDSMWRSFDGIQWEGAVNLAERPLLTQLQQDENGCVWDGTQWVHLRRIRLDGSAELVTSSDGVNWQITPVTGVPSSQYDWANLVTDILYVDNHFIFFTNGEHVFRSASPEGPYTNLHSPPDDEPYGWNMRVAQGSGGVIVAITYGEVVRSTNSGASWTRVGYLDSPVPNKANGTGLTDIAWNGDVFIAVGRLIYEIVGLTLVGHSNIWRSTDGVTWTFIGDDVPFDVGSGGGFEVDAISWGGGQFVIVPRSSGFVEQVKFRSDDGYSWVKEPLNLDQGAVGFPVYVSDLMYVQDHPPITREPHNPIRLLGGMSEFDDYWLENRDGPAGYSRIYQPKGLCVEPSGSVLVSTMSDPPGWYEPHLPTLRRISRAGVTTTLRTFSRDEIGSPDSLCVKGQKLYIGDRGAQGSSVDRCIHEYDLVSGVLSIVAGGRGTQSNLPGLPGVNDVYDVVGVTVGPDGDIWFGADGVIGRLELSTGNVTFPIEIEGAVSPRFIGETLYFIEWLHDVIYRSDPPYTDLVKVTGNQNLGGDVGDLYSLTVAGGRLYFGQQSGSIHRLNETTGMADHVHGTWNWDWDLIEETWDAGSRWAYPFYALTGDIDGDNKYLYVCDTAANTIARISLSDRGSSLPLRQRQSQIGNIRVKQKNN